VIPSSQKRPESVVKPDTQSFIVKVWIEENRENSEKLSWRGHITHVPSAEKRYIRKISELSLFIASYLQAINVQIGIGWRLRLWLRSLSSKTKK
jgi:hypothetical protein